jgi:Flp pilus assembly protein TadD
MSEISIPEMLVKRLEQSDLDLVDIISIPSNSNRDARLRTLEDALQEFDSDESPELQQYLVQLRPRRKPATQSRPAYSVAEEPAESMYHPDGTLNVPYLMKNADLLVSCGDYALAKNIYQRVAQAGQSSIDTSRALFALASCYENEGKLEEARDRYEQSITFQPTVATYQHLATLLIRQKKDRPAAETLERALNLKDLSPKIRYELLKAAGNSWMRAGEMAAAERAYKRALDLEPTADEIQANLGALYLQAGKHVEARRKFQDTLASNPRNDKAVTGLGICLLTEGDKRGAHDQFARALEINLQNTQAIYHLVKCAYELKTYATAARLVESYVQVGPVNINLMYSLAGLQFHLGRMSEARATIDQILNMNSSHTGAKDLLQRIEVIHGN